MNYYFFYFTDEETETKHTIIYSSFTVKEWQSLFLGVSSNHWQPRLRDPTLKSTDRS
jgi:hypothetical protein